jgi:release factor glutamine methyltransferase
VPESVRSASPHLRALVRTAAPPAGDRGELAPPTVREVLRIASARLAEAGCESPRLDAELLLAESLGSSRMELVLVADDPLHADALVRFERLLARRQAREPLAYITGRCAFRRLDLGVDRRVLIPRPETELLVEVGLGLPSGWRVADVGTGSGAIALALADERADLRLTGIDLSPQALALARANGERLGLDVRWALADLLDDQHYDAVIANLPYVEAGAELAPEIARYEPAGALFAGPDGLAAIRRLLAALAARRESRLVALEVGAGQAAAVRELLAEAGFAGIETLADLAGHERVLVGAR